jgi:hypothetical protein
MKYASETAFYHQEKFHSYIPAEKYHNLIMGHYPNTTQANGYLPYHIQDLQMEFIDIMGVSRT